MTSLLHKICKFCLLNRPFFSNKKANSSVVFIFSFFLFLNVKCVESASQKKINDVMSFQLHVDIDTIYILNHFPLLEFMTIESTCTRVKDLDLYIIDTESRFI